MAGVAGRTAAPRRARKTAFGACLALPLSAYAESDPEPNVPAAAVECSRGEGGCGARSTALCRHSGTPLVPVEISGEHADAHLEGL